MGSYVMLLYPTALLLYTTYLSFPAATNASKISTFLHFVAI